MSLQPHRPFGEHRPFAEPMPLGRARLLPWATVMGGSLVTILPIGVAVPLLPPFGLLVLLAWRLLAPLALRLWAPALLGFFDDLVSGQPIGSSTLLWPAAYFLVDALEARSGVRDFWQSWVIAAVAIALVLFLGRLIATPTDAWVGPALGLQIAISVLVFPLVARFVAWLDLRRQR